MGENKRREWDIKTAGEHDNEINKGEREGREASLTWRTQETARTNKIFIVHPALSDISNFKAHIIQFPVQRQQIFKSHLSGVYSRRCPKFSIDRILEEIIREEKVRWEREKK